MKLQAWAQSDPGKKRERNEDSYLVDPAAGVLAVADGMGGHQGGATASRMAVDLVGRELAAAREQLLAAKTHRIDGDGFFGGDTQPSVRGALSGFPTPVSGVPAMSADAKARAADGGIDAFGKTIAGGAPVVVLSPVLELMRGVAKRASAAIFEASWGKPDLRGMGTTLTAGLVHDDRLHLVHAGDSRCYLFRDGTLRQLTDDHSWIAEQMRSGAISEAEAKSSKFRHVITKSIGFERDIDADLKSVPVSAGDCFLLCSDGMSNYIEHGELERIVAMTWYRQLPQALVELANQRGGDDNITVVVGLVTNANTAS